MKISQLMQQLQTLAQKEGDLEVVSGVVRSGYGEPVIRVSVRMARSHNKGTGEFDGPVVKVFDMELSDESIVGP